MTRASFWSRWPDEDTGPLWAGIHWEDRDGAVAVVGVELFSEPPADARSSLGPGAADAPPSGPVVLPPTAVRSEDLRALRLRDLVDRFRASSGAAGELVPAPTGGRPRTYTDDHFARVAACCARALAAGDRRTARAVAEHWSVSVPTANRWIARARALGLMPPS